MKIILQIITVVIPLMLSLTGLLFFQRKTNIKKEAAMAQEIIEDNRVEQAEKGERAEKQKVTKVNKVTIAGSSKFIVIMENNKPEGPALPVLPAAGHGICLYAEIAGKKYLLDAGSGDIIIRNAAALGIDLADIDRVFVSHGHSDHGGGLLPFLEINNNALVYLSPQAIQDKHYAKVARLITKDISLDSALPQKYPDRFVMINEFTEVQENIFVIPRVKKIFPLPSTNANLYKQTGGTGALLKDDFEHEQLLVIRADDGLIVYSGCCHSGVLNVINTVREAFPHEPIKGVIGGFHLLNPVLMKMGEHNNKVIALGEKMREYKVKQYITGHCTGLKAYLTLKQVLGNQIDYFYTGKKFTL